MVQITALLTLFAMGSSVLASPVAAVSAVSPDVLAAVPDQSLALRQTDDGRVPGAPFLANDNGKVGVAGAINKIVDKVLKLIENIEKDITRRQQFTQDIVTEFHAQFPGHNIVVCNVGYTLTGDGWSSTTQAVYKAKVGQDVTYDVILFNSPKTFVRNGDGGYQNWAYMIGTNCNANGGTLDCPAH